MRSASIARPFADAPHTALVMVGLIALSTILLLNACSEQSTVEAESREIPLTRGNGINQFPRYSPNGELVAFTTVDADEGKRHATVYVVSAKGGEPKQVSKTPWVASGWLDDETLLVFDPDTRRYAKSDLAGDTEPAWPELVGMLWIADIAPDGRVLICEFTGDNCDLSVASRFGADDKTLLFDTAEWEMEGCFGPGPDEITMVRQNSYGAGASEIQIFSLSAREVTRTIPIPEARNINPAWSPDRKYLVYASDRTGNLDLWIYDPVTERSVQLTTHPEDERSPDWSPDGEWITFRRSTRTSHVFVGDPETLASRQLTQGTAIDAYPVVSPDGKWVAFIRQEPGTTQRAAPPALCVVSVSETDPQVRALDLADLTLSGEQTLCWSPDASQIAFSADDGTGNIDVYRIVAQGGRPVRVTITPGLDTGPSWSPDGSTIAYTRLADGETQIWTVPANGGIARQLTDHEGASEMAVWADDSDHLAYVCFTDDWRYVEVWTTSMSDRDETRKILAAGEFNVPRAWSRDGTEVLVQQREGERNVLLAVSRDGTAFHEVGKWGTDKADQFWILNADGERYRDRVYPGGVMAFDDGDEVSNIIALRVPELTEALHADGNWN